MPYLAGTSKLFLMEVTMHLKTHLYAKHETFGENFTLYILKAGMGNWSKGNGKICLLTSGSVWGEEHLLLTRAELLRPNTTTTMTFSEALSLERKSFNGVCEEYPEYSHRLRRQRNWYVVSRSILAMVAKEQSKAKQSSMSTDNQDFISTDSKRSTYASKRGVSMHEVKEAQARRSLERSLDPLSLEPMWDDSKATVKQHALKDPIVTLDDRLGRLEDLMQELAQEVRDSKKDPTQLQRPDQNEWQNPETRQSFSNNNEGSPWKALQELFGHLEELKPNCSTPGTIASPTSVLESLNDALRKANVRRKKQPLGVLERGTVDLQGTLHEVVSTLTGDDDPILLPPLTSHPPPHPTPPFSGHRQTN